MLLFSAAAWRKLTSTGTSLCWAGWRWCQASAARATIGHCFPVLSSAGSWFSSVALHNYVDLFKQPWGCRYKSIQRAEPLGYRL